MTDAHSVTLSILDSVFEVTTDDPRMTRLIGTLWEPFLSEGAASERFELSRVEDGWRVDAPAYPGGRSSDPWTILAVLRNLLSGRAIRAASGIVPVHGAAAESGGRVVVLSGPARTGKTTLLLSLLEGGWSYVTDDLVPIRHDTLTATPFAKPLSIRDQGLWTRVSHLWPVPGWMPAPVEIGLVPATAFPRCPLRTYVPTVVVFPRFAPGAPAEVEALSPAAAVALAADNLHVRAEDPVTLATLAKLGSRARAYAVGYGSTAEALELFGKCLAAP